MIFLIAIGKLFKDYKYNYNFNSLHLYISKKQYSKQ